MTPIPSDPSLSLRETQNASGQSTGWNLHILSPEESERLLRDESLSSAFEVLAQLER